MQRTAPLLLAALAMASNAAAGTFSVSGPGGNIPDAVGTPGTWNVAYAQARFASDAAVAHPVTRVTAVRLHGLRHTWRGDLRVYLQAPDGTIFHLVVRPGFNGANAGEHGDFVQGEFRLVDGGASLQQGGADLGGGDYAPFHNAGAGAWTNGAQSVPLGSIAGPAGIWRLVVEDWASMDTGALTGWTLEGVDQQPGGPFCAGDHLDPQVTTDCPCANPGAPGHGCANSASPLGAVLSTSGSTAADDVVLHAQGLPATAPTLFLQGDAVEDAVFGDGVRCTGGTLVRLRTKIASAGSASFPEAGDPSVSSRGGVLPGSGDTRFYQAYYRNAAASFCTPETFNISSGWVLVW